MRTRTCTACGETKPIEGFPIKRGRCKPCYTKYKTELHRRPINKAKKKEYQLQTIKDGRFKIRMEKRRPYMNDYLKKYYRANKKNLLKSQAERNKVRRREDTVYKLTVNLRQRTRNAIKLKSKVGSAVRDLGCSGMELIIHLEKKFVGDMNWGNYGKLWNIDHIIPLSLFDLEDRSQFLKASHFTNLQSMLSSENFSKGNRLKVCNAS